MYCFYCYRTLHIKMSYELAFEANRCLHTDFTRHLEKYLQSSVI